MYYNIIHSLGYLAMIIIIHRLNKNTPTYTKCCGIAEHEIYHCEIKKLCELWRWYSVGCQNQCSSR